MVSELVTDCQYRTKACYVCSSPECEGGGLVNNISSHSASDASDALDEMRQLGFRAFCGLNRWQFAILVFSAKCQLR